jgi:hypothetical protein
MRSPLAIAIAALLLTAQALHAGGPCSGVKGGCGRSTYRSSSRSSSGSVHVSGYTRSDGTYVRPHTRSLPGHGSTSSHSSKSAPAIHINVPVRTEARTAARVDHWNGTSSTYEEPVTREPRILAKNILPKRFVVNFESGRKQEIHDFSDDGDSYTLQGTTGGKSKYPKRMIESVVSIEETASADAYRTWKSSDGQFQTEAVFLELKDGNVRLCKRDGRVITVAVDRLSKEDRAWLATRTQI